jgi:hypothetical protein
LHVSLTDAHKKDGGRYVWRVDYPRDTTGYEHGPAYGEDRASITTACTKTPAQCAADIARRLLPVYLPQYARSLERVASANAYTNETQANLATLAALVGGRVNIGSRDTVWVPGSTIYRLSVSGDSVTLDLRLTMAQAVAVLQIVKEEVTPDE